MPIKNLFGILRQEEPDEYLELDFERETVPKEKITVQVEKMIDYSDSDRIQEKVRGGNILLVKIKDLKNKDMAELKRAITKVRKTCMAINGDIAGVGDDWLVITPATTKIHRGPEE